MGVCTLGDRASEMTDGPQWERVSLSPRVPVVGTGVGPSLGAGIAGFPGFLLALRRLIFAGT